MLGLTKTKQPSCPPGYVIGRNQDGQLLCYPKGAGRPISTQFGGLGVSNPCPGGFNYLCADGSTPSLSDACGDGSTPTCTTSPATSGGSNLGLYIGAALAIGAAVLIGSAMNR